MPRLGTALLSAVLATAAAEGLTVAALAQTAPDQAAAPAGTATQSTGQPSSTAPKIAAQPAGMGEAASPGQVAQTARAGPVPTNLCVGCHSPPDGAPLSGMQTGKWLSPNITPDPVSGIGAWSRDDLFAYLRHGRAPGRVQAGGPMAAVVEMLQAYPDVEILRLVDWMQAQPPHRVPAEDAPASERGGPVPFDSAALPFTALGAELPAEKSGQALYNGACASCHGIDGAGSRDGYYPPMFHNTAVGRSPPANLLAATLDGIMRHIGDEIVMMPSFDGHRGLPGGLSDADLASLVTFVAQQWGDPQTPALTAEQIARTRAGWWGEGEIPTSTRGELVAAGEDPEGPGIACLDCHGPQGQGDDESGTPRIAGLDPVYFAKQMRDYAQGSRPNDIMSPIAEALSESDWHALATYYAALPSTGAVATAAPDPALVATGKDLHLNGAPDRGVQACADCHAADGNGFGSVYPSLLDQPAIYIAEQLRLWREGVRHNDPHDLMGAASRPLTDEDMAALSAYLAGPVP